MTDFRINIKPTVDRSDVAAFANEMRRAANETVRALGSAAAGAQAKFGAGSPGAIATRGLADIEGQLRGQVGISSAAGKITPAQQQLLSGAIDQIVRDMREAVRKSVAAAGRNLTSDLGESAGARYRSRVGRAEQETYQRHDAEREAALFEAEARKQAEAERESTAAKKRKAKADKKLADAAERARPIYGPPEPPKSGVAPGVAAAERKAKADKQLADDAEKHAARQRAAWQKEDQARDKKAREPIDAVLKRMGLLPPGALEYYKEQMGSGGQGLRNARAGAGPLSALDRYYGLNTGIGHNEFANNTVLPGDTKTLAEMSAEARANLTSLERMRQATEELAKAEQYLADLMGLSGRDMYGKLRAAAGPTRQAELLAAEARLEGTAPLVDLEGRWSALQARRAAEIRGAKVSATSDDDIDVLGQTAAAQGGLTAAIRARTANERRNDERLLRAEADRIVATNLASSAAKRMAADTMREMGVGREAEATPTQRLQAWIANRAGGDNLPRPATDFMRGKQLIGSRIMTTASFAASGGLLYGALNLGGDILRESTELQVELGIIESQIEALEGTANSVSFEHLREEIHKTSLTAGVEANEVANVTRQLAGAFADPDTGNANFALAQREADVALRYSKISPLSQQEITDSLSATSLAFRDPGTDDPLGFERILDTVTTLENRFGVLGPEIVKFTADLAPLGKELGFTQEQLSGLGAVAQSRSGRSGTVLSEQIGRILPSLQAQQDKLYELFSLNANTEDIVVELMSRFGEGDIPGALSLIVQNYKKLDKDQQNQLASIVGSRRESAAFYALLDSPALTSSVLGEDYVQDGQFEKRWDTYEETVRLSFDRMRRAVEEFGQKLFDAGIDDLLVKGAQFGVVMATGLSAAVDLMGKLNDLTGGHLSTVIAATLAWRALAPVIAKANVAARLSSVGGAVTGALSGRGAAAAAPAPGWAAFGAATLPPPPVAPARSLGSRVISSSLTRQLSAALAGYALLELQNEIETFQQEITDQKATMREGALKLIEEGATEEELIDSVRKQAAAAREAEQEENGLSTFKIFGREVLNPIQDPRDLVYTAARLTPFDPSVDRAEEDIVNEILSAGATFRAEGQAAQVEALLNAFSEIKEEDETNFAAVALRFRQNVVGNQSQLSPSARAALNDPRLAAIGIDDGRFYQENLQALLEQRRANPGDVVLEEIYLYVMEQAGKDAQLATALAVAITEMLVSSGPEILEEGDSGAKQEFDAAMDNLKAAYDAGRVSYAALQELYANRRAELLKLLKDALEAGEYEYAATVQRQIDSLDADASGGLMDDLKVGSDIRSRLDALKGTTGRGGAPDPSSALSDYEQVRGFVNSVVSDRADAAATYLEAVQEDLDRQLSEATDPAERDRILAQRIAVSESMRTDLVAVQLQSGRAATIRDLVAKALGVKVVEAEALIAQSIVASDDINESIVAAGLEAQRMQTEAAISMLSRMVGGGFLGRMLTGGLRRRLQQIEAAMGVLGELDSVDDILSVGAKGDKGGGGSSKASDANAIADAYGALLSAQLARDPVAQAQQNLANANAAVARADTEAGRLQALAQQVSAQHALEDAMQAMWEAQVDVANAMSESVGDVVAVANRNAAVAQERLRVALANGTGGAELYSLQAAAIRAQTEAVETARSDRIGDLEYLYEFDKITAEQFIKSLQAELLLIPEANKEARREIERRIKALRDEMSSNMSMNIPSEITLPTLYEARRLNQNRGSGGPAWGTYSQLQSIDNRVVTINVYESGNVQRTTEAVAKAMDSSPRSGSLPTGEWV